MNAPNNKRKRDSQNRIEKVFLQLIQKKEIKDITVSKICELANVNRTTFYANYLDIPDLVDKVRIRMINEYASLFENDTSGNTPDNYLKLFRNVKENQLFYKTYFKLGYDKDYSIAYYDKELAKKRYNDRFINYHCHFFQAGISEIIKMWLDNGCKESPEDMLEIILSEYNMKNQT